MTVVDCCKLIVVAEIVLYISTGGRFCPSFLFSRFTADTIVHDRMKDSWLQHEDFFSTHLVS